MLCNTTSIHGATIVAKDGPIGSVSDLLFDDGSWRVRWLVVETGTWLSGRKVLLPVSVLGHLDSGKHEFFVKLTKKQIESSPDVSTDQPVSRQMESNIFDFYGWSPYWSTGFYMGGYGYLGNAMAPPPYLGSRRSEEELAEQIRTVGDPHLRSTAAVTGYHIHARDGELGHVEDFLVDESDWTVHFLVVDTKNWWPGKRVLISPRSVRNVEWVDQLVNLSVNREQVKASPAYDTSTDVDQVFEEHFHRYYTEAFTSDDAVPPIQQHAHHDAAPPMAG